MENKYYKLYFKEESLKGHPVGCYKYTVNGDKRYSCGNDNIETNNLDGLDLKEFKQIELISFEDSKHKMEIIICPTCKSENKIIMDRKLTFSDYKIDIQCSNCNNTLPK